MVKYLLILAAALGLARAAEHDMTYMQRDSAGEFQERTVTLTPSTFLRVGSNGTLTTESTADFKTALGLAISDISGLTTALGDKAAASALTSHTGSTSNPHSVTASQVGLGSVENTALSTWVGSANITTTGNLTSGGIPYSLLTGTAPTWDQNTTGTASNVTGIVSIAHGGTGNATASGGLAALGGQPLNTYLTGISGLYNPLNTYLPETDGVIPYNRLGYGWRELRLAAFAYTWMTSSYTVSEARSNLQLGTLATQNGTFSGTSSGNNTGDQTAATLSGLSTVATTGNYTDLNLLPTLGTASSSNSTDFATAAQGASADQYRADVDAFGFLNPPETSISFNPSGGTSPTNGLFTLSGTNWSYYARGVKYTVTGNRTVQVPDADTSTQVYYIYIDNGVTNGNLTCTQSIWDLNGDGKVPVASVVRNSNLSPAWVLGMELHTVLIPQREHMIEHYTTGGIYSSGGELSGITSGMDSNAAITPAVAPVSWFDEDIYHTSAALADSNGVTNTPYTILYKTGAGTWAWQPSLVPFRYAPGGFAQITNNTAATVGGILPWTTGAHSGSGSNSYINYFMFITNWNGQESVVWIPGQSLHSNTSAAYAENFSSLNLAGLPVKDGVAVWQCTYRLNGSALGKATLTRLPVRVSGNIVSSAAVPVFPHDTLSGLSLADAGVTYGHISDSEQTIAGNKTFTGALTFGNATQARAALGLANVASSGNYADLLNLPALGTLATQNGTFSDAAQLAGDNTFTGNNTFSRVNIGTSDYGWRYNPAGGGQMELVFPGGTAAWYQTGTPAKPYMYFAGTIQADNLIGAISGITINASGLSGTIPYTVMSTSMGDVVSRWMEGEYLAGTAGITYAATGPLSSIEPTPASAYYYPAVYVNDGGADVVNTLSGKYRTPVQLTADLSVGQKVAVPASITSTGRAGDYAVDADYLYICTATNTWRRTALTTW